VFTGPGKPLEIRQLPDPEPGPRQLLLRIVRCGICATDLLMSGDNAFTVPPGYVLGHERGAEVIAVGKEVERFKVGDHVVPHNTRGCGTCDDCRKGTPFFCKAMEMNMAGFAQCMVCDERFCAKVPHALSLADAALVEPLAVGLHACQLTGDLKGRRIAVLGAGPMGLGTIFWARQAGAGRIATIATSRQREAIALGMGSDAFLTNGADLAGELTEALGGQADVVFECTGAPGTIAQGADLVKARGTVTVLGMCAHVDSWTPAWPMLKELRIQFGVGTSLAQFGQVAEALSAGHVEPRLMVTDTVSMEQLPASFEALKQPSHHCKVMLDPWAQ
jgi:(R,R)-butanediol dehydrogenase/meso-butanediol dehydrogenase/diacetyl reductase